MNLKKFQRDDSAAGNTSGLWIAIFQYHFNVRDGFAHRPGYRTSRGGFIDITSVKWIGGNHTTYCPYLITQKKKKKVARHQNRDAEWAKGEEQLERIHRRLGK